jgi:hypothetical protein
LSFYEGVGVLKVEESELEVLKIEESESELLCTDSTALIEGLTLLAKRERFFVVGFSLAIGVFSCRCSILIHHHFMSVLIRMTRQCVAIPDVCS